MQSTVAAMAPSGARYWTGWVLTGLSVLFSIFDGVTKLLRVPQVVAATTQQLGFPIDTIPLMGGLLLAFTALYAVPRTAVLGAVLLTAYLGGAVAANIRVHDPVFETIFPILFAVIVWLGIYLREGRLQNLLPVRR